MVEVPEQLRFLNLFRDMAPKLTAAHILQFIEYST
jgi:hypothetical protein